ncbi:MAG: hypothetical protein AAB932_06040 [Patescibacteria group bacterium]
MDDQHPHPEITMPRCSVCGTPLSAWEGECPSCEDQRQTADWDPGKEKDTARE